jgi:hypothetical protein
MTSRCLPRARNCHESDARRHQPWRCIGCVGLNSGMSNPALVDPLCFFATSTDGLSLLPVGRRSTPGCCAADRQNSGPGSSVWSVPNGISMRQEVPVNQAAESASTCDKRRWIALWSAKRFARSFGLVFLTIRRRCKPRPSMAWDGSVSAPIQYSGIPCDLRVSATAVESTCRRRAFTDRRASGARRALPCRRKSFCKRFIAITILDSD